MRKWLLTGLLIFVLGTIGNFIHDAMLQGAIDKYTHPSPAQEVFGIKNRGLDGSGH